MGGCGHQKADQKRTDGKNNRGVERIIEVGALLGAKALFDGVTVPIEHILLLMQDADGAHIFQRLGDLLVDPAHGNAVFHLRVQHSFLKGPGHPEEQGRNHHQDQA